MSINFNEIVIGQYRFSKNLGNGSFGKVKSKFILRTLTLSIVAFHE